MYLIVGAGFLGTYLLKYLSGRGAAPVLAAVRSPASALPLPGVEYIPCDVTRPSDVAALAQRCAGNRLTVFYFAACHNVDYLFRHADAGRAVNIDALQRFLDAFPDIEKLFFASTDCVYGENPPHIAKLKETDVCLPINEYGRQKLEAEGLVRRKGFTSVRLSYMLGPSLLQKRHFYDTVAAKLAAGEPVEMIDGMMRSALSYETAAALLAELSLIPAQRLPETVNLCGDGVYSKYDLGAAIARAHGFDVSLVKKIPWEQGQVFFKDRRANILITDNTRLKSLLSLSEIPFVLQRCTCFTPE